MFRQGKHNDLFKSLETIGASFAIYELQTNTLNFKLVSANTLYEKIIDQPIDSCIDKRLLELLPRYIEKPLRESFQMCLNQKISQEVEIVIERQGVCRWWRSTASPIFSTLQHDDRVINTCIEITDKKILEQQLNIARQRFQAVIENSYDGIITIDNNQNVTLINQAARDIFGISEAQACGASLSQLIPSRYREKHFKSSVYP